MTELRAFVKTWWCRGGGAAVVMLLAVVSVFRDARDGIFWAALAFFAAHSLLTVLRYRRERSARATATVLRHHDTHHKNSLRPRPGGMVFTPPPPTTLVLLKIPPLTTITSKPKTLSDQRRLPVSENPAW